MYTLETDRLVMRPFCDSDVDFLNYLHSDLDVTRYTLGRTRSHNENIDYVKTMLTLHDQGIGHLVVIRKSDSSPIGRCGYSYFYGVNDGEMDWFYWGDPKKVTRDGKIFKLLELGYTYAKPAWGHGFATEAALAFQEFGYTQLGYDGFSSLVIKENIGSINVARKMGAYKVVECMTHDTPSFDLRNKNSGNGNNG